MGYLADVAILLLGYIALLAFRYELPASTELLVEFRILPETILFEFADEFLIAL